MNCNNCKPDWKCNQGRCGAFELQQRVLGMRNNPDAAAMQLGLAHDPQSNWPLASGDHEILSPLPGRLTLDEWLQRRMPSDNMGFALALAIVGGIFIGVLLVHAWARM